LKSAYESTAVEVQQPVEMYRELLKDIDWRTKGAVTPVVD
jgi:hypothetical protein